MNLFLTWFASAIQYGTVILYGAMGEIITEKAGHLNLGTPRHHGVRRRVRVPQRLPL